MFGRIAILLALTTWAGMSAHAAGEDDEAWIGRYVSSGKAPGLTSRDKSVRNIEFGDLARMSGRRARFTLSDGRERRGIVMGVAGSSVQVRAQLGGGEFLYTLARNDIRAIQAD